MSPEVPKLVDHVWSTQEEYEAQLALPVHYAPGATTLCGLVLGSDEAGIMRATDDWGDVTCPKCKRKKPKK